MHHYFELRNLTHNTRQRETETGTTSLRSMFFISHKKMRETPSSRYGIAKRLTICFKDKDPIWKRFTMSEKTACSYRFLVTGSKLQDHEQVLQREEIPDSGSRYKDNSSLWMCTIKWNPVTTLRPLANIENKAKDICMCVELLITNIKRDNTATQQVLYRLTCCWSD